MPEGLKSIVLGGGMTGLCAAFYLAKAHGPERVLLLEAADTVGGAARTDCVDGFVSDWGPNGFLDKEPLTLKWVGDLGLADQLVRANEKAARRFIYKKGRLYEVKPPPAFLASPLLSLSGRARLLCEPLIKTKRDDAPESIWDFAARRIGREAADMLAGPMVSGVYGGDAKQLSLAHCFPRMQAMEREYGSLARALLAKKKKNKGATAMGPSGVLTTFAEGIATLPAEAAKQLGACVRCGTRTTGLRRHKGGFQVDTDGGETLSAESVVVAMPAHAAAGLCEGIDRHLAKALQAIPYADMVVLCTGHRREQVGRPLDGFGFLAPRTQGLRALGCIWTSSLFPHSAPKGWVLLRTMFGGFTDPEALELSDDELLALFAREVHPLLDISDAPGFVRIYRHRAGIPQYLLGHGLRLKTIEEAEEQYPGLVFAGNAYRGVGLNDCVVSAHRAVARIAALA